MEDDAAGAVVGGMEDDAAGTSVGGMDDDGDGSDVGGVDVESVGLGSTDSSAEEESAEGLDDVSACPSSEF